MKQILASRTLSDETRKQGLYIAGEVYSLHIKDKEAIITDNRDYTKIYAILSLEFAALTGFV